MLVDRTLALAASASKCPFARHATVMRKKITQSPFYITIDFMDSFSTIPGITLELMKYVHTRFLLGPHSIHGPAHWQRVWENGQRMALLNGANLLVVALFAFTHDVARLDEGGDWQHGPRAARLIETEIQGKYLHLAAEELDLLVTAVYEHTNGHCYGNITVRTCYDADRLDLGRVGIRPDPRRLCTVEAKDPEILRWAYQRSVFYPLD